MNSKAVHGQVKAERQEKDTEPVGEIQQRTIHYIETEELEEEHVVQGERGTVHYIHTEQHAEEQCLQKAPPERT